MLIRHADAGVDADACAGIYAPSVSDSVASLELIAPDGPEFARRIATIERTHPFLVAVDERPDHGDGHGKTDGDGDGDGKANGDGDGKAHGDGVVGFAYASPFHERAGYRWSATASVYVDARHHRRGIGRELYGTLLALLRCQGLWVVCSGITLPNDASVALHESCGFELVGVYKRIGWKAGAWRDVGWWQLSLRAPDGDGSAASRTGEGQGQDQGEGQGQGQGQGEGEGQGEGQGQPPPEPGPPARLATAS